MHQTMVLPLDPLRRLQLPNGATYLEVGLSIDEQGKVMSAPSLKGKCECFNLLNLPSSYPEKDYVTVVETILNQMNLLDGPSFQPGIKDGQVVASDLIWTFEIQLR